MRRCSLVLSAFGVLACAPSPAVTPPSTAPIAPIAPIAKSPKDEPSAGTTDPVEARPDRSATPELDAITLPPRPEWTDKYFEAGPDQRRFEIGTVMKRWSLNRAQAVEVQNHYRDLARTTPDGDLDALLAEAIRRAEASRFEDRRDVERLANARFIVVFDLDDTLYDQYVAADAAKACHDLEIAGPQGSRFIKLVPGWERALRRIVELGGAVVLFSANTDDRTWVNGRAWLLGEHSIVESPIVSGFLTNSHLVQQHKREGDPVQEPSKDLRVVDETLRRAIIVDDNPDRIAQRANLRLFKKFHAEELCGARDPNVRRAYTEALPRVVWEIEDSVRFMEAHPGTDFATAYRPFTALGQVAATLLRDTMGWSSRKATEWLRSHPEFIDDDF